MADGPIAKINLAGKTYGWTVGIHEDGTIRFAIYDGAPPDNLILVLVLDREQADYVAETLKAACEPPAKPN